jgi:vacuolar-type H+-ATPase subunit E/Vma4
MDDFTNNKQKELRSYYHIEAGKIKRKQNRKISESVTELKRELNQDQKLKKDILFQKVAEMLHQYMDTLDYVDYLKAKIKMAQKIAGTQAIVIYLNASDVSHKRMLEETQHCTLTISDIDFMGGIRAVIRSRNILIDESFTTKLNQERKEYTF